MSKPSHLSLNTSPLHQLHRVMQCADKLFQTAMSDTDLTPRQLAVLSAVAGNDSCSQTRIVEITGVDRSTLADLVRRLTKKGLVQRKRSKFDARAYAIRLTEKGGSLLAEASLVALRVDQHLMTALPEASRSRFNRDLQCIIDQLGNHTQKLAERNARSRAE